MCTNQEPEIATGAIALAMTVQAALLLQIRKQ